MPKKSSFPDAPLATQPFHEVVLDALWKHSVDRPNAKCLIPMEDPSRFWTHRDVWCAAHSVACFLFAKGFQHKDIACTVLPNCPEFASFLLGVGLCGGTTSPASTLYTEYELTRQFTDCFCKAIVTDSEHLDRVVAAKKSCPWIEIVLVVCDRSSEPHLPIGTVSFRTALCTTFGRSFPKPCIDIKKDIFLLPYSSGTSGMPKGVMLTHFNYGTCFNMSKLSDESIAKKRTQSSVLTVTTHPVDVPTIHFLPVYHIHGLLYLFQSLLLGAPALIFRRFKLDRILQVIQDYKIPFLPVVPTVLLMLLKGRTAEKYDLSSLVVCTPPKDVYDLIKEKIPHIQQVIVGYGATEICLGSHGTLFSEKYKPGSSGKLIANMEQKIIDPATGVEVADGEVGELCLRGPNVMLGYLKRPTETAEAVDKDGWYHTGDLAYLDADDDLFVVGRLKELIKVKGLQVPPAELEDVLLEHDEILDAGVVGVPDPLTGEAPLAFVVRNDDRLQEGDVQNFVKERLAPYKQLRGGVRFVKEIPRGITGKVLRLELRKWAATTLEQSKL